ncbi:hypothetical protein [Mesoterricola silvestris]|uniref:Uncharacterized protein n=1 Tax=Mesoterricola silvestris TaxID=2927979 RepID=A0AA48GJ89_9BACT|nr:hypothetical protein [Mesoterricola silvestris]BDU74006.1 hypothetical protein METEAL_31800 [Mesoterricola silvestris]
MWNRRAAAAVLLAGALQGEPPGKVVVLEAATTGIPPLPASVAEARKGYGRVRKELDAAYREAEAYLAAGSRELAALGRTGTSFTLPASLAPEARTLSGFLFDGAFLALEEPLLQRWNEWQTTLLRQGLARPAEAQRMADAMRLLSSSKAEVRDRVPAAGGTLEVLCEDPAGQDRTVLRLPPNVRWVEVLAVDRMPYGANTEFGKLATAYADAQATLLAEAWTPLTAHLKKEAAALLDLDRTAPPTEDPALKALRLMARVNYMERFRSTLWFCQVVWAHMASRNVSSIRQM